MTTYFGSIALMGLLAGLGGAGYALSKKKPDISAQKLALAQSTDTQQPVPLGNKQTTDSQARLPMIPIIYEYIVEPTAAESTDYVREEALTKPAKPRPDKKNVFLSYSDEITWEGVSRGYLADIYKKRDGITLCDTIQGPNPFIAKLQGAQVYDTTSPRLETKVPPDFLKPVLLTLDIKKGGQNTKIKMRVSGKWRVATDTEFFNAISNRTVNQQALANRYNGSSLYTRNCPGLNTLTSGPGRVAVQKSKKQLIDLNSALVKVE